MKNPADMAAGPANKGSRYAKMYDEWSQMPQPDPQNLLKILWTSGILSEMQKEAIAALLSNPQAAAGGAVGAGGPAAPEGAPAPAAGPAAPMGAGPAVPPAAPGKVSPV